MTLLCALRVGATELPIREEPFRIIRRPVGASERIIVDWGTVSETLSRDARVAQKEQSDFLSAMDGPIIEALVTRVSEYLSGWQDQVVAAMEAGWREAYEQRPRATRFDAEGGLVRKLGPLPRWLEQLPQARRKATILLWYDDRDPAQRAWVLRKMREFEYGGLVFALGWESEMKRDEFSAMFQDINVAPIYDDDMAAYYGVTKLPAVVTFPTNTTILVEQGLDDPVAYEE